MKGKIPGIIIGAIIGFAVIACTGDSDAGGNTSTSGPSDAEFAALESKVESLEQQVAILTDALETLSASVNVVVARGGDTAGAMKSGAPMTKAMKLAGAEAIGCAYSGWLPASQREATTIQCKTSTGYLVDIPWPAGGAPVAVDVFYESAGCMGTPYTPTYMVEDGARQQGVIATYYDGTGAHVGMVVAGSPVVTRTTMSLHNGTTCADLSSSTVRSDLIEVVPHVVDANTDADDDGLNDISGGQNSYPAMSVE